ADDGHARAARVEAGRLALALASSSGERAGTELRRARHEVLYRRLVLRASLYAGRLEGLPIHGEAGADAGAGEAVAYAGDVVGARRGIGRQVATSSRHGGIARRGSYRRRCRSASRPGARLRGSR